MPEDLDKYLDDIVRHDNDPKMIYAGDYELYRGKDRTNAIDRL